MTNFLTKHFDLLPFDVFAGIARIMLQKIEEDCLT